MRMVGSLLLAPLVAAQDLFLGATEVPLASTPLDDYVNKPDPNFKWRDTGSEIKLAFGKGYLLNVTSQQWLDETRAVGPNGALWTHQVLVIVPDEIKVKDRAMIYITGGCNENPGLPSATDEEPLLMSLVSKQTGSIGVVLFQIPNCHMMYPSDPSKSHRSEDAMISWAWHQFLTTQDPEWLPRLPMVKAAMAAMRSVQEYTTEKKLAEIDGWLVSGASKRGWTTWMTGAVNCPTCPKVVALAPIVPIVPDLKAAMHHMFQAYGGWTFAFDDYTAVNLTREVDSPGFEALLKIVDPMSYIDRLAKLPKAVILASDDEFMMFEWTRLWYSNNWGETHLTICPNAEHSEATGIPTLVPTLANFANSVYLNGTRPKYDFSLDLEKGKITVTVPETQKVGKVVLRHAHTLGHKRRDFRWVALPEDGKCATPSIGVKNNTICVQPIIWTGDTLTATQPGVYEATLDKPLSGWTGYYVEMYFPSDTGLSEEYMLTTSGMVWPQELPFPDCTGAACEGHLV